MLRRLTACLLALLLLTAASATAAEPDELAILSQWDERFYDNAFRYNNNYFRFNGCGPASITNALIAALDITDQDLAVGIERDVLYLLTNDKPVQSLMQSSRLRELSNFGTNASLDTRYPSLSQAIHDFGGQILYEGGKVTADTLERTLSTLNGSKALYHGSMDSANCWKTLYGIVTLLSERGYKDAVIVLGFLSAGTENTVGPFRSGTAGHYLGLYLWVEQFSEEGIFCVLDSFPRALEYEYYDPDETTEEFDYTYDFVGTDSDSSSLDDFNAAFMTERIQTTVVRVRPADQALRDLNTATGDELPFYTLQPYLEKLVRFFGTSEIFIVLPEQ